MGNGCKAGPSLLPGCTRPSLAECPSAPGTEESKLLFSSSPNSCRRLLNNISICSRQCSTDVGSPQTRPLDCCRCQGIVCVPPPVFPDFTYPLPVPQPSETQANLSESGEAQWFSLVCWSAVGVALDHQLLNVSSVHWTAFPWVAACRPPEKLGRKLWYATQQSVNSGTIPGASSKELSTSELLKLSKGILSWVISQAVGQACNSFSSSDHLQAAASDLNGKLKLCYLVLPWQVIRQSRGTLYPPRWQCAVAVAGSIISASKLWLCVVPRWCCWPGPAMLRAHSQL